MSKSVDWDEVQKLLGELEFYHNSKLMQFGRKIVPTLTQEDVLQPNDFPELENNPLFRYEEGLLAGIRTAQMALRRLENSDEDDFHQMEL